MNLTTSKAPHWISAPGAAPHDVAHTLDLAVSALGYIEGKPMFNSVERMPNAAERNALSRRLGILDASLQVRDGKAVARAISGLMAMFGRGREDDGDFAARVEMYVRALDDVPAWAVVKACDNHARGRGTQQAFMPTSAELHVAAENLCSSIKRERRQIVDVLTAEPRNDGTEEPENVRASHVASLKARLGPSFGLAEDREERRDPKADFEALCASAGVDPNSIPDAPMRNFRKAG